WRRRARLVHRGGLGQDRRPGGRGSHQEEQLTSLRFSEGGVPSRCPSVFWAPTVSAPEGPWCRRWESNPHARRGRRILSPLRLPFRHSGLTQGQAGIVGSTSRSVNHRLQSPPEVSRF